MLTLVFNGWAAGSDTWDLCTFRRDWTFSYLEEMDGLPERVLADIGGPVFLVGFSLGGSFALETALRHPDRIGGMVLVSATARMFDDPSTDWKGMTLRRRAAFKYGTRLIYEHDPSPLYAEENLERGLDVLLTTDQRAALLALPSDSNLKRIPITVFQSARDGIVRPHNAEFLKRVFPQATVHLIPGTEHVLPVTIPELIDIAIRKCQNF